MASTYSPNLRIELIAVGEQSNTWGVTTNSNLGTLIEQAISGVVSVSVTAGDVTLTALNGATDQSRQMIIIATGTPGVARVITAPAVGKVYVVHNNSDASLSFIASGGTGVTLIVGAKKYIYCDGTNFYEAIDALTVTSGTIDGTTIGATTATTGRFTTLTATSGTIDGTTIGATTATTGRFTTVQSTVVTGTAPFIVASTTAVANLTASNVSTNANLTGAVTSVGNASSLGSFTSAQLATALTDETGTGANVFATSPTLVTPALGTPSALVGTNITGTATAFTASNVTTNADLTGVITSSGNATSLGSFTSAQLATALTNETGSGSAVFATSPTLITPVLGTPVSGNLINCTMPSGSVLQVVNYQTGALTTGTTLLPADDTIPQNTEGFEVMTLAITPKFATSMLIIQSVAHVSANAGGAIRLESALFQDTTASALAASSMWADSGGQCQSEQIITHKMTSGTTSATTFKIRVGSQNAGTISFNGQGGSRLFGGVMASSITIWEIAA